MSEIVESNRRVTLYLRKYMEILACKRYFYVKMCPVLDMLNEWFWGGFELIQNEPETILTSYNSTC